MSMVQVPYQGLMELLNGLENVHANARDAYDKGYTAAMVDHCKVMCVLGYEQMVAESLFSLGYTKHDAKNAIAGVKQRIYEAWDAGESASDFADELSSL